MKSVNNLNLIDFTFQQEMHQQRTHYIYGTFTEIDLYLQTFTNVLDHLHDFCHDKNI